MSAFFSHPRRLSRLVAAACIAGAVAGCASSPSTVEAPVPATRDEKLAWILWLEDQRLLRDPSLPPATLAAVGGRAEDGPGTAAGFAPAAVPDLLRLARDPGGQVRYRAVQAIGRVGLAAGGPALAAALSDPEPDVRAVAAFGLGLLGRPSAVEPLIAALADPSPLVQARAAHALGRLPAPEAAGDIQAMAAAHVTVAYDVDPDEMGYPLSPRVEAFRSGVGALAALGDFDALASVVLTDAGEPLLWWWPVAEALARVGDPRGAGPLRTLAGVGGTVGVAMAARGLGELGDASAVPALVELLDRDRRDPRVVLSAVRALGALGDAGTAPALRELLRPDLDPRLLIGLLDALGAVGAPETVEIAIELLAHRAPAVRGAALTALAGLDPDTFLLLLSGLPPDPHWQVRADLARALALADPDAAAYRLSLLLEDEDRRVVPAVLRSLAAVRAPGLAAVLPSHLSDENAAVRETAARLLGDAGSPRSVELLAGAYRDGANAASPAVRAAAVDALARIGGGPALETLREALDDPDWAVRVRAAARLAGPGGPDDPDREIRSSPLPQPLGTYESPELVRPSISPHVYLDTDRGTIQIELVVNETPLACGHFMRLARSGYYDGVLVDEVTAGGMVRAGDARGRAGGGPGYRVRDELGPRPYLRGTVGLALDGADTGSGGFFITASPQPRLDGRYPVLGAVIGGMDVVERLQRGDVIHSVRVWDGRTPFE